MAPRVREGTPRSSLRRHVPYAGDVLTDPEMQRLAQTIRGCWQKAGTVYCTVAE